MSRFFCSGVAFFSGLFHVLETVCKKDENILERGEQNTSFGDFFDSLVSPLPRDIRQLGCCYSRKVLAIVIDLGAVAAFARAPRTCGGTSQFFQGAPAAEQSLCQISTSAFRSRFAPPFFLSSDVKIIMKDRYNKICVDMTKEQRVVWQR
jgi:hypothetical protein